MGAFLAIVDDTWRQSKQQFVFLGLIGLMVLFSLAWVFSCKVFPGDGAPVLGIFWQEDPKTGLEESWDAAYRAAIAQDQKREERLAAPISEMDKAAADLEAAGRDLQKVKLANGSPDEELAAQNRVIEANKKFDEKRKDVKKLRDKLIDEAQKIVDQREPGMTPLKKGVEVWMSYAAGVLFTLSMWGFIAACAGYFPGMLAAGAVDVLVSKPISRFQLFFGKYAGGLVLYAITLLFCYLLVFVGVGIRTGVWHGAFFSGLPLTLFSVALLYAMVALVGVLTRSTALAIVIGYIFYFVVDTIVGLLQSLGRLSVLVDGFDWVNTISDVSKALFPGFDRLQMSVKAAVVHVPIFEWQPFLVGVAWLGLCLGGAYWRFKKLDF